MCILVSSSLLFPYSVARTSAISSECNIDLVEYTDWMPLLLSDLMEEIDVNPQAFHQGLHNYCTVSLIFLGINLLVLSGIFLSMLRSASPQCLTIQFFLMPQSLTELQCLFYRDFKEFI